MTRNELLDIFFTHDISVDVGCSFGDHWSCSCGETGLDSSRYHLVDVLEEEFKKKGADNVTVSEIEQAEATH